MCLARPEVVPRAFGKVDRARFVALFEDRGDQDVAAQETLVLHAMRLDVGGVMEHERAKQREAGLAVFFEKGIEDGEAAGSAVR